MSFSSWIPLPTTQQTGFGSNQKTISRLLVDHEHVDAPAGKFGEELCSGHGCRLGGSRHGD
jgi:hypothetical protein